MATITASPVRSDAAIREDVIFELKWDPKISSSDIGVAVKKGVVTLAGFAHSYFEKDAAEKAAKRVYGDNDLETEVSIAPWEAALGGKVTVPTLDGPVEMTIPA